MDIRELGGAEINNLSQSSNRVCTAISNYSRQKQCRSFPLLKEWMLEVSGIFAPMLHCGFK